jgi:glycosyltransferase involved in cell wall biosynthesis
VTGRLGAEAGRTVVIPNGFDPALLSAREDSGARDPFLLLSVGRLQGYKRVDVALRSLALLDERHRLAVVGDGPQREELKALAATLGLAGRVDFAGRASDGELIEWYRRAGTVISLSAAEAFGMTVLEGVAAGSQVVASDIPAFKDLARLFPGQVITVDAGAPEQVAQAARQAVTRAGNALADVSAFTWDAVTERLVEVYRGALGQARVTDRVRKREDGRKVSDARTGAE